VSSGARDSLHCHSQRAAAAPKPRLKQGNLIKKIPPPLQFRQSRAAVNELMFVSREVLPRK